MAKRGRKPYLMEAEVEARKEIRTMYNKLRARIKRVESKYGDIPAVDTYYERGLDKLSTKGKSLDQLNILRAEIEYVSTLKTSYIEGAERYHQYVAEWIDLYDKDKGLYDDIMRLYNRLVEENELAEKFKYQVIEDIYTIEASGVDLRSEEAMKMIREKFNEIYLNTRIEDVMSGLTYVPNKGFR